MEADEPKTPVNAHLVGMVIDTMSVEELQARINMLETEIARLKSAITAREQSRSAADAFFKR